MKLRRDNRGAALIIAVAVLAVLTALSLVFYTASRLELRMATNQRDTLRAGFAADAGLSMAYAFLRYDQMIHPTVTSVDHAWKTYFSGAWFAGKDWIWDGAPNNREANPKVTEDGMFDIHHSIYIPRGRGGGSWDGLDSALDAGAYGDYPFVTPDSVTLDSYERTPAEVIHDWADVDLDDDGLRDSVWIPVPIDVLYEDDGIDNDLDGETDEAGETAVFVYLDDDGVLKLTAPIQVDLDDDGVFDSLPNVTIQVFDPESGALQGTRQLNPNRGSGDIDSEDNDFSLAANDSKGYAYYLTYDDRIDGENAAKGYQRIDMATYFPSYPNDLVITSTGEPVCEIAGRVAVLIKDEASKANINTANAVTPSARFPFTVGGAPYPVSRALSQGSTPGEYDLRLIPGLDIDNAWKFPAFRTGEPEGQGFVPGESDVWDRNPFEYDLGLPGYGLVDDDGDAFWATFNGLDDNADGFIDSELQLSDLDGDGTDDDLGWFEGIDEPDELRLFRPYRNMLAEDDGVSNDGDDYVDEIGEFGDQFFHTRAEAKLLDQVAGIRYALWRNYITPHSRDSNDRFRLPFDWRTGSEEPLYGTPLPPRLSGAKLDYNYATPDDIGRVLVSDWGYEAYVPLASSVEARDFTAGLRLSAAEFTLDSDPLGTGSSRDLPMDPKLRAYQLGANIADYRDVDYARSMPRPVVAEDAWAANMGIQGSNTIRYKVAGLENIRINEIMVRATRRVEAEAVADLIDDPSVVDANQLMFYANSYNDSADPSQFFVNEFSTTSADPDFPPDFDVRREIIPIDRIVAGQNGNAEDFIHQGYFSTIAEDSIVDIGDGDPRLQEGLVAINDVPSTTSPLVDTPWRGIPDPLSTILYGIPLFGAPNLPSIVVAGRSDTPSSADWPKAPYTGAASYVALQAKLTTEGGGLALNQENVSATTVAVRDGDDGVDIFYHEVPNMVVFRFGPGPGLPPGRYYLLANTTRDGNNDTATIHKEVDNFGTATIDNKLRYVLKYGTEDESILNDVLGTNPALGGGYLDFLTTTPQANPSAFLGTDASAVVQDLEPWMVGSYRTPEDQVEPTGYVLLPGRASPINPGLPTAELDSAYGGGDEFYANTVVIPPYAPVGQQQEYLYLAVWKSPDWVSDNNPGGMQAIIDDMEAEINANPSQETEILRRYDNRFDLCINWFEFSQEPDHEYVELVNVGNEPVDVRGWTLEVGAKAGGAGYEDDHSVFTIGTPRNQADYQEFDEPLEIAPGGTMLLAFNKYDGGADNFVGADPLAANGIGMAATVNAGAMPMFRPGFIADGITVPPFPMPDPRVRIGGSANFAVNAPLGSDDSFTGANAGSSIFVRPVPANPADWSDLVDLDGDGVDDGGADVNLLSSPPDDLPPFFDPTDPSDPYAALYEEEFVDPTDPTKGSRYVWKLNNSANKPWDRIVELRPGPSTKSVSSFEDLAELILRGGYFPNYPDEDYVDNDDDNNTLQWDPVDHNGNGVAGVVSDAPADDHEGIDEGRLWLEARRRGPAGPTNPIDFSPAPGRFDPMQVGFIARTDSGVEVLNSGSGLSYLGTDADPPYWKDFVERRFYPGDNVVIRLHAADGSMSEDGSLVADEVTYTQRDVENRDIMDVDFDFFQASGGTPYTREDDTRASLWGVTTGKAAAMWPDNTMGTDFYRALERKHPLYSGDQFGTTNRWEPTDGAYDDWDAGEPQFWVELRNVYPPSPVLVNWEQRFAAAGEQFFTHSLHGSPMRPNFFQRALESRDQFNGDGGNSFLQRAEPEGIEDFEYKDAKGYSRPLPNVGQLAQMPDFGLRQNMADVGAQSLNDEVNTHVLLGRGVSILDKSTNLALGRASDLPTYKDLDAVLSSGADASLVLTCAQADFYPVWPPPPGAPNAVAVDYEKAVRWDSRETLDYPQVWSPVFLFDLGDGAQNGLQDRSQFGPLIDGVNYSGTYPVELDFIFETPALPSAVSTADLAERWPLEKRAVMYVCANVPEFDPLETDPYYTNPATGGPYRPSNLSNNPAEALFAWDADDGLENGEYDLYVATADNLRNFKNKLDDLPDDSGRIARRSASHQFDAYRLLDVALDRRPEDLGMTIEVFTDRDRNRRCWNGSLLPQPDTLDRPGNDPLTNESFGMVCSAEPSPEGIIYYGRVTVENNYLAVFLRNWGQGDTLNRFSRVILAGRARTPGRMNINTVENIPVRTDADYQFNPLQGIPGVLAAFSDGSFDFPSDTFGIGPTETTYFGPSLALAETIVANRPEYADGRYYRFPSHLLTHDSTGLPGADYTTTLQTSDSNDADPDRQRELQFLERIGRYGRLSNLITTRSDVFEITVLGQTGYVVDQDGDGKANYRTEFEALGEKKYRVVYNRK